jgi:HlyD family secretion protein
MHAYPNCSRTTHLGWRAGLALLVLLAAVGCRAPGARTGSAAGPTVTVAPVQRAAFATTRSYTGNVQAQSSINVLPKVTGHLEQLFVDVGSVVRAGDPIAVLDRHELGASVQQAAGALQVAQSRLDLVLAQGRAENVQQAQAQLAAAEQRLSLLREGGRPADVVSAEANLTSAQAQLRQLADGSLEAEVAAAQTAVEAASASVQSSREALAQLLTGGAPTDQAAADAAIAAAQGELDQAVARRDALRHPPADQVASARADVANAEASLAAARTAREQLLSGGTIGDQVTAQSAVDDAATALAAAQASLAVLTSGGQLADRASAQAALANAQAAQRAAKVQYDATRQGNPQGALAANQAVTAAQQDVQTAQNVAAISCVAGPGVAGPASATVSAGTCATAQQQVTAAQAQLGVAQYFRNQTLQGSGAAANSNAYAQLQASAANVLAAQAVVTQLNNPSPDTLQAARTAVDTAQANLGAALARQADLRNPPAASVTAAQAAVQTAENTLEAAGTRLALLLAGGAPEDQAAADAAIATAQGNLAQAVARREGLRTPPAADVAAARAAVDTAEANWRSATQQLAAVGPKTAAELQTATGAVVQAQNTLLTTRQPNRAQEIQQQEQAVAEARANLALQAQPYRPQDVAQAQAAVAQAQGAYDLAQARYDEAFVYAPFDGAVSVKLLDTGALASPATPIVTLVSNGVQVWVNVEDRDLADVRVGGTAQLSVLTLPGETFDAQVEAIGPAAEPQSRTFPTKLVTANADGRLKDGMLAQVQVHGDERDATQIPSSAVVRRSGQTLAFVVVDGKAQQRPLELGSSAGGRQEVLAGVQPGEQVIAPAIQALNDGDPVTVAGATPGA